MGTLISARARERSCCNAATRCNNRVLSFCSSPPSVRTHVRERERAGGGGGRGGTGATPLREIERASAGLTCRSRLHIHVSSHTHTLPLLPCHRQLTVAQSSLSAIQHELLTLHCTCLITPLARRHGKLPLHHSFASAQGATASPAANNTSCCQQHLLLLRLISHMLPKCPCHRHLTVARSSRSVIQHQLLFLDHSSLMLPLLPCH